jgi:hypothetical protein
MVIFGSIADFSIDLFRDVAPFAASAVFEIEDTWWGETLCGDFLFAVFFVERASLSARIRPLLVRLVGGDLAGSARSLDRPNCLAKCFNLSKREVRKAVRRS